MKKNKKIVLLIISIIAILLLAFIGGRAYAQYMSKVRGKGNAEVASWSFKVNENEERMQMISLKSTMNNSTLVGNKIAPGTEGNFQIKLDATGTEVGINYFIKFENETQKPTNLKFVYNGNYYNSLEQLQRDLTGTINSNEEEKIKKITIGWDWKYETGSNEQEILKSDMIDTKEAKEIKDYNFDIIVSGTQVMPQN